MVSSDKAQANQAKPQLPFGGNFGHDEGGGYGPHYKGLRDDLDVPTFIRKQMD